MVLLKASDASHPLAKNMLAVSSAERGAAVRAVAIHRAFPPRAFQPTLPSLQTQRVVYPGGGASGFSFPVSPRPAAMSAATDECGSQQPPPPQQQQQPAPSSPRNPRPMPPKHSRPATARQRRPQPGAKPMRPESARAAPGGGSTTTVEGSRNADVLNGHPSTPAWPAEVVVEQEQVASRSDGAPSDPQQPGLVVAPPSFKLQTTAKFFRRAMAQEKERKMHPLIRQAEILRRQQKEQKAKGTTAHHDPHGWRRGHPPPRVRTIAAEQELDLPTKVVEAVDVFDVRHRHLSLNAAAISGAIDVDITSDTKHATFRQELIAVRRQRLVVHEQLAEVKRYTPRTKKEKAVVKSKWKLGDSMWAPRVKWCDSRDFKEKPQCLRALFELDWKRCKNHGLAKFINRNDDGDSDEGNDSDGDDEDEEVKDALWDHHQLLFVLFDYYAAMGSGDNVFAMKLNSFSAFVNDFALADKNLPLSDWDQLFIAVDAAPQIEKTPELAEPYAQKKMFSRCDFLHALVRSAVLKYVKPKLVTDVSRAVETLIEQDIKTKADPVLFAPTDEFRRLVYNEEVDTVLRKHEPALRLIHETIAALKPVTMEHGGMANKLVAYGDWMKALRMFNLINDDITEREATLSFILSRMRTINEHDAKSRIKMTHLHFVDVCARAHAFALPHTESTHAPQSPPSFFVAVLRSALQAESLQVAADRCRVGGARVPRRVHLPPSTLEG